MMKLFFLMGRYRPVERECLNKERLPVPCCSRHKKKGYCPARAARAAGKVITWLGMAVVGILALPAGALTLLISGVWSLTDRISRWITEKGDEKE